MCAHAYEHTDTLKPIWGEVGRYDDHATSPGACGLLQGLPHLNMAPRRACGSSFPSLSLSSSTRARKGLPEVISKVLGSVLPGQSPATLCPQSPSGSCDSAARSSTGAPSPAQHTQRASCYHSLPAGGWRGLRGERPGGTCVSRTGARARQDCLGRAAGPLLRWIANSGTKCSGWAAPSRWPLGEAPPRASAWHPVF